MSNKEITTGGGAAIEGDVSTGGGDITGRDRRREQSARSDPSQNMYVTGGDSNSMGLWAEIMRMAMRIQELSLQMDNLPDRVAKLERTEVIVKPGPEVLIRQVAAPEVTGIVLSAKTLLLILMVSFVVIVLLVTGLIYLGVRG